MKARKKILSLQSFPPSQFKKKNNFRMASHEFKHEFAAWRDRVKNKRAEPFTDAERAQVVVLLTGSFWDLSFSRMKSCRFPGIKSCRYIHWAFVLFCTKRGAGDLVPVCHFEFLFQAMVQNRLGFAQNFCFIARMMKDCNTITPKLIDAGLPAALIKIAIHQAERQYYGLAEYSFLLSAFWYVLAELFRYHIAWPESTWTALATWLLPDPRLLGGCSKFPIRDQDMWCVQYISQMAGVRLHDVICPFLRKARLSAFVSECERWSEPRRTWVFCCVIMGHRLTRDKMEKEYSLKDWMDGGA